MPAATDDTKKLKPALKQRGGARPGAGRKTANKIRGEVKKAVTVRLFPSQAKRLIEAHGSVQKAIDSL
jgi:hypothetical protein